MSSAGTVLDCLKRQQHNRNLQKQLRARYQNKNDKIYSRNFEDSNDFNHDKFARL